VINNTTSLKMSSRQLQKLAKSKKQNDDDDVDEDDEEEEEVSLKKSKFVFDSDSDSDSDSDKSNHSTDDAPTPTPPPPTTATSATKVNKKKNANDDLNDDEYLDKVLEQKQQQQQQQQQEEDKQQHNTMLLIDPKAMDIDAILRRRFGNVVINDNNNNNNNNRGNANQRFGQGNRNGGRASNMTLRKLMFCNSPNDSWKKPPSYGLGGISMTKVNPPRWYVSNSADSKEQWYSFEWSKDFIKLHQKYQSVQSSGDVNRLVIFLAKNYYHFPGLLQLAMIYTSVQNSMDKAHDLIRNVLYIFECSFIESFKPAQAVGYYCRMDFDSKENNFFFTSLFRHMQISNMLGCASLSADIAKLIFSLDPYRDPLNVLIHLDHFYLTDNNSDSILQWLGYNDSNKDALHTIKSPFALYSENDTTLFVSDLPTFWYSGALACFLKDGQGISDNLLQYAIKEYPFMIIPLLLKSNIDIKSNNWKDTTSEIENLLLKHPDSKKTAYLKIASFYASRNGSLWNRDIVHEWFLRNARCAISSIKDNKDIAVITRYGNHPAIKKYSDIDEYDLLEEMQRLPAEANPIDPGLNLRELQNQNINFRALDENNFNNLDQVDDILNDLIDNLDGGEVDENLLMEELVGLQDMGININIDHVLRRIRELQRNNNNNRNNGRHNDNNNNNGNANNDNNNNGNDINNINDNDNVINDTEGSQSVFLVRKTLDLQNNIIIIFLLSLLPWYFFK